MKIIDLGLVFITNRLAIGNIPRYIGLHHSAGIRTVLEYHQMHKDMGMAGLAYNYIVDTDGKVYIGRPIQFVPAGILGHNQDSLHICAIGNFDNMTMPAIQTEAIKELIVYCKSLYKAVKEVKGHGELTSTDCPGKNYPLQIMKDTFTNGLIKVSIVPTPSPIHNKVFKLQHALNSMGITDASGYSLVEDGWMGQHTQESLAKVAVMRGTTSPLVGWIQEQLGIPVDNIYGSKPYHQTYDAIVNYQTSKGLTVDGVPGKNTILSLAV